MRAIRIIMKGGDVDVFFKDTNTPGVLTVHRKEDEQPFAELHSPSARGCRTWGIKYRTDNPKHPFDQFNASSKNRESAEYELALAIKIATAKQLCLE
jgi:hypothetical protein